MAPRETPPIYQVIADGLRTQILSGELAPGARVPGENTLMQQYDVSRTTARQALDVLKAEGLIETRQGGSTTVRAFKPIRRPAGRRLSREVWGSGKSLWNIDLEGRDPEVLDVTVEEVEAPAEVAAVLGVDPGSRVWRRSRLYGLDETPVQRAISYLAAELVAGTAITQPNTGEGGTYARLGEIGHAPTRFEEDIRVRMPLPEEAEDLQLRGVTPIIVIVRTAWDAGGRVVEVNEMKLNSTRYVLNYEITS